MIFEYLQDKDNLKNEEDVIIESLGRLQEKLSLPYTDHRKFDYDTLVGYMNATVCEMEKGLVFINHIHRLNDKLSKLKDDYEDTKISNEKLEQDNDTLLRFINKEVKMTLGDPRIKELKKLLNDYV